MKGIYLGLEALGTKSDAASLFDKTIAYYEAMAQFSDAVHEFSKITSAYESVCSINACIKKYGVTQSVEALFGENFRSTASMEEETEAAKQGLGAKIKSMIAKLAAMIKGLWDKFVAFIKGTFDSIKNFKFKKAFSFKKKNGESVEVKSQSDLDKARAAVKADADAKLNKVKELKSKIDALNKKSEKEINDSNRAEYERLSKELEETKKEMNDAGYNLTAFKRAASAADKALKSAQEYDPDTAGGSAPDDERSTKEEF